MNVGVLCCFYEVGIRMAGNQRRRRGPLPQTKVTIVGKTEIHYWKNLVGPLLVHKILGPPPASLPSDTSLRWGGKKTPARPPPGGGGSYGVLAKSSRPPPPRHIRNLFL